MADGQLFKPEKDYTKDADKQIPEAEELAKVVRAFACFGNKKLMLMLRAMSKER